MIIKAGTTNKRQREWVKLVWNECGEVVIAGATTDGRVSL